MEVLQAMSLVIACVGFASLLCVSCYALTQEEIDEFTGDASVVINPKRPNRLMIKGNGIPVDDTDETEDAVEKNYNFRVPRTPEITTATCLKGGPIAITIEGVVMFGPLTSSSYNAVEGSNSEAINFDECNGHTSPQNVYHYHYMPSCVYDESIDKLIGVAFDGWPIYGPISSWINETRNATAEDLDECHGKVNPDDSNDYRYIATYDFPYILGCYRGTPIDGSVTSYPDFGDECVHNVTDEETQEIFRSWSESDGKLCRCNVTYPDDFDNAVKKRELDSHHHMYREHSNRKFGHSINTNYQRNSDLEKQAAIVARRKHVMRKVGKSGSVHHLARNIDSEGFEKKIEGDSKFDEVYRLLRKWLRQNQ